MKKKDVEADVVHLLAEVETLKETFLNQEEKLRNMANKLENHLFEPDAHHVALVAKKKKAKAKLK